MSPWSRIVLVSALVGAAFTLLAAVPPLAHLSSDLTAAMPTVLDRVAILLGTWSVLAFVLLAAGALAFAPRGERRPGQLGPWPLVFTLAGLLLLSGVFPRVRAGLLEARYESQKATARIVLLRCGEAGAEGVLISPVGRPGAPGDWGPFQRIAEVSIPSRRRAVEVPDAAFQKASAGLLDAGLLLRDRPVWDAPRATARGECVEAVGIERGRFHYHVARVPPRADRAFDGLLALAVGLLPEGEAAK